MKKILITGANSYIGNSLARHLAKWPEDYRTATIDMLGDGWLQENFSGCGTIIHVAGIAHTSTKGMTAREAENYWSVNALLPVRVAEKAKAEGVRQFIFLSSMSVYGEHGGIKAPVEISPATPPNPKDIYGKSKLSAEEGLKALQDEGFSVCILRPPMIYGPGCRGNYPTLSKFARKWPLFPSLNNRRSMLFIGNLERFVKWLIDEDKRGLFLPHDPVPVATSQLVPAVAAAHGRRVCLTGLFNPFLRLLSGRLAVVDKVFGSLTYTGTSAPEAGEGLGFIDFQQSILITEEKAP